MAVKYWFKTANGSDNWATAANWYNGSGGTGGTTTVPTSADDVILDAASGTGTITIAAAAVCNSLTATNFLGALAGTSTLAITNTTIGRDTSTTPLFAFGAAMTQSYTGTTTFGGSGAGIGGWIYCNGQSFKGPVTFNSLGRTFTFKDTFRTPTNLVTLTAGTISATEANVEFGTFTSTGTGAKNFNCTTNLSLTGTSILYTLGTSSTNLTSTITNIIVSNGTTTAKTLLFNAQFGSTNLQLAGAGSISVALGTTFQPAVTVTNTGPATAIFNISAASTITSLTFGAGVAMTWTNAAVTVTILNDLTLVGTLSITATPSLIFTGPSIITMAGESLLTGTVVANGTTTFADAFSSNAAVTTNGTTTFASTFNSTAAVTLNASTDIKTNFSTTSTITQGITGVIYMSGSSLTATTTTIAGTMIPSSSLTIAGALTLTAAAGNGTLSTPANSVITCTGTTTLQNNATVTINGSYTSNAITVTNGNINVTTSTAAIPLICTNTLSFTAGIISADNKTVYAGSIATSGTVYKGLAILNLYLTGTGALYTQTSVAELYSQVSNLYIVDSSNLAKTLSCTTQFPYYFEASSNIYLAGSGSGTITVAPVTTAIPNIYVTNTNGTASFSTGTINSLTFSPGTTTNWNNATLQTLTINTSLTLTGSMACTVTPALTFSGTGTVRMAGKSLVTGALISNGSTTFIDAFSSNAAVTLNSSADIYNNFSTTSTLTVGSDATAYIYGSSLTATTTTVAGTVQVYSNLGITGSITVNAAVGSGALTTPANLTVTCTGTTTLQNNATVTINGSYTSNTVTITNGTIDASTGTGILTCTNILSLSTGAIHATNSKTLYAGSITTSGAGVKDLYISNLYLTGTGALYTQTSVTNLTAYVDNTYIVNSSGTAKILTCTTQFPYNTSDVANIYLAGSGAGTITLAPSTVAIPKIYVTNTGGAPISFSTGTVYSIFFNTGTTAVWSNAASQIITMIAGELNLAASIPLPTQTPAFIFQNEVILLCNGVPLVGGGLTCDTNSSVYINSLFNSNVAVTVKSGAILYPSVTCTVASVALQGGQLYVLSGTTNITGTLTATTGASSTYGPGVLNIGNGITATGATTTLTLGAEFCNLTGDTSITGGSTLTVDTLNMIFPGTTSVYGLSTVNTTLSINNSGITFTDLYLIYANVPYTGYSLTCTGILSTSGDINIAADPISVGNFINVSNQTEVFVKTITCTDFIFTGIGTLHDAGTFLTSTITNVYVNNNSTSAKTLTFSNGFGSANLYLQGSQNGSLTLIPGTAYKPNVYVTNTGGAAFNISTAGTIGSLIFDPTSNVNWNNSAVAVTLIGSELTLASSITASATPSLVTSNPIAIAMAGKSLATGTLIANSTSSFIDAFSSNAAVTTNGPTTFISTVNSTAAVTANSNAEFGSTVNSTAAVTLNSTASIGDTFSTTGTLTIAGLTNLTGQYISASALTVSGLTAALNVSNASAVTCTGTTTLTTGGRINYSGSFTSNAITVTSGFINGWDYPEVGTLTCTGILTMTSGSIFTWPKDVYVGSITTTGASPKTIYTNNLKLTGTGTLFTPGSATNFSTSTYSVEIIDPSGTPKTLTCTSQFPIPASPIYLAGSGSITIGPGTATLPYIYVTSTTGASVSFLTGTATSLIFSPGTNATWNNLPGQTLTLQNELTLTSSQPLPLLTPSLAFVGNGDITMAGKSLVTGTLTVDNPSTVVRFLDNFNTNAAVAFSDAGVVYTPYNFTAPSVTVGKTAYWLIGLDGYTSIYSSPTVTIAGGLTITGTSAFLGVLGGTLNVAGAISQTATGGGVQLGDPTAKLPVTISCTTFTVSSGNSFYNQFNATINLSGTGTVWNMGTTLLPSMELSTINITDTSAAAITFAGGQGTYKDVIFNRGAGGGANTVNHSNFFVNLRDLGTAAHTLTFQGGHTTTVFGTFDVKGSPGNIISILRSTPTATYLQKGVSYGGPPIGAGLVLCDYVAINAINALDYNGNTASGIFYTGPSGSFSSATGWNTGGKVRAQGALGVG